MTIEHLFFYKDSFGKDGKIQDVRKNAVFFFFFNLAEYTAVSLLFSVKL